MQTGSTTYYEVALTAELSENVLPGMQIEATMTREKIENALLLRMDALQYDTNGRVYAAKEGADGKLSSVELTLGTTTAFTFRCFPPSGGRYRVVYGRPRRSCDDDAAAAPVRSFSWPKHSFQ